MVVEQMIDDDMVEQAISIINERYKHSDTPKDLVKHLNIDDEVVYQVCTRIVASRGVDVLGLLVCDPYDSALYAFMVGVVLGRMEMTTLGEL